jgi:hypothetical protein
LLFSRSTSAPISGSLQDEDKGFKIPDQNEFPFEEIRNHKELIFWLVIARKQEIGSGK